MSHKIVLSVLLMKMSNMTEERLYEIVASRLSGEKLTKEEDDELQNWLDCSEENRRLYKLLQCFWDSGQAFRDLGGPDRNGAYRRIAGRCLRSLRKRKIIFYRKLAGIAVAVFLLAGLTLVWQFSGTKPELSGEDSDLAGIMPNTVRLELSNGEYVNLSSRTTVPVRISDVQQAAVVCDSNLLKYTADDEVLPETPEYNTLIVPVGAEYRLLLSDGTQVYLNAASELRYPTRFTSRKREVFLKGEAYFEVSRDTTRHFTVRTAGMDIEVYGTSFDVDAYEDNREVSATLTSGKIKARCQGREYDLVPGQQVRYDPATGKTKVEEVCTEVYTCWKDGYYYFEAVRLEDIMQTLSRWYNIQAFFVQPELKDIEFTGRLKRYEEVGQLFRKFEQTRNIRFERKGNSVVVSGKD